MSRSADRRRAVFACYQREVVDVEPASALRKKIDDSGSPGQFARDITTGVEQHRDELEELISKHSRDWDLERVAPLERSIMKVALYEMLYRDDVPDEVAIDEAIELTKRYCGSRAPAFINGILGAALIDIKGER